MSVKKPLATESVSVAVAIPCYNEAAAVRDVIAEWQRALPGADIIVFDNNSTDGSGRLAIEAGAAVIRSYRQGKGNVVQDVFRECDHDVVIMVDGDGTCPADEVYKLLEPIIEDRADMVVGTRLENLDPQSMSPLHRFGNWLLNRACNAATGAAYRDILSGYRLFNRRFLDEVVVTTSGFEIETDLSTQAVIRGLRVEEIPIRYRKRTEGTESKLRAYRDGVRILVTIASSLRDIHPLRTFTLLGLFALLGGLAAGLLPRVPDWLAIVAVVGGLSGFLLLSLTGLLLNTVNTRALELRQQIQRSLFKETRWKQKRSPDENARTTASNE